MLTSIPQRRRIMAKVAWLFTLLPLPFGRGLLGGNNAVLLLVVFVGIISGGLRVGAGTSALAEAVDLLVGLGDGIRDPFWPQPRLLRSVVAFPAVSSIGSYATGTFVVHLYVGHDDASVIVVPDWPSVKPVPWYTGNRSRGLDAFCRPKDSTVVGLPSLDSVGCFLVLPKLRKGSPKTVYLIIKVGPRRNDIVSCLNLKRKG